MFQFSQSQAIKISKPELCIHITFIHIILFHFIRYSDRLYF